MSRLDHYETVPDNSFTLMQLSQATNCAHTFSQQADLLLSTNHANQYCLMSSAKGFGLRDRPKTVNGFGVQSILVAASTHCGIP
ncbi:hypothetical protein [Myxococcus sp. SDU36]|uniref:hypothetical protein n=1 Tax=Myxococcus sp. SDU36 TaxID=2831967 RepID=UPI0025429431|nr:hypothetical protein [Myxococcus sp. SDU36]WIG98560.1 hypothetical protein KGD87_14890 [Myxococcus sp. SDU36]